MPATATTTIKGPETKAPVITASAIGGYLIGLFGGMLTASPKVFMREQATIQSEKSQRDGTKDMGGTQAARRRIVVQGSCRPIANVAA